MADYSTIKGFNIPSVASDPIVSQVIGGTWTATNPLNTTRWGMGGVGVQTAALASAGSLGTPGYVIQKLAEEFDGTSWTEVNDLNTARRYCGSLGLQTAAITAGGGPPNTQATEQWNGTSWTEVANVTGTQGLGMSGTVTAGLAFGGSSVPGPAIATTTEFDGTSWSAGGDLTTARINFGVGGAGTQTAGLAIGGNNGATPNTEEYDGTSWAEGGNMNSGGKTNLAGWGTQTDAMAAGGVTSPSTNEGSTEGYDGTSWATGTDIGGPATTSGLSGAGAGQTSGLIFGGDLFKYLAWDAPTAFSTVQEGQVWYNSTSKVLKGYGQQGTAAWASGGAINTGRKYVGSGGLTTAAWIAAGNAPSAVNLTIAETYDGTSWTEVNDMNTGRSYVMGSGSSTAALAFGGWIAPNPPGTAVSDLTESYNATSWTEVADLNTARRKATGQGTNTAALLAGGSINSLPAGAGDQKTVETWNGTSWTEVSDLNTARMDLASATQGTPTAALVFGGSPQPAANQITESYNGTSWTEVADLNTTKTIASGAGVQAFALCWGGINPPFYSCEQWNGTSWTEVADIGISQYGTGHGGTAATAWQAAGTTSPGSTFPTAVEEFNTPSTTKTFTSS